MSRLVLGVDQGTSSTRCVALDAALTEAGSASVPVASAFPAAGRVEQDPEALAASVQTAIGGALDAAGASPQDVAALGIANQTETFVLWDRETGRPLYPAIVWQDRRSEDACTALRAAGHEPMVRERTGLELDATFPATKVRWVLDHVEEARAAADAGRAAYGDVASWLLWRLAGTHVTDAGNAGRSLLCRLGATDWDDDLLELLGIDRRMLPPIVDTDGVDAALAVGDATVPVRAVAGDQQASLFGLRCWTPGSAKVTLGTGAFVLVQAGGSPALPPTGVLASCAWRLAERTSIALEGFVPTAGAATDWFAHAGLLPRGPELDALLREPVRGDAGVVCVPALQGTGTPGWDAGVRGTLLGLDLGTTRAELARAVVDGVLHQVADAVEAIAEAVPVERVRLDGGLARSDWIAQRLADLAGLVVERPVRTDATAIGAAAMAGLAAGFWDEPDALPDLAIGLVAEPTLSEQERDDLRGRWTQARQAAERWR